MPSRCVVTKSDLCEISAIDADFSVARNRGEVAELKTGAITDLFPGLLFGTWIVVAGFDSSNAGVASTSYHCYKLSTARDATTSTTAPTKANDFLETLDFSRLWDDLAMLRAVSLGF